MSNYWYCLYKCVVVFCCCLFFASFSFAIWLSRHRFMCSKCLNNIVHACVTSNKCLFGFTTIVEKKVRILYFVTPKRYIRSKSEQLVILKRFHAHKYKFVFNAGFNNIRYAHIHSAQYKTHCTTTSTTGCHTHLKYNVNAHRQYINTCDLRLCAIVCMKNVQQIVFLALLGDTRNETFKRLSLGCMSAYLFS